MRIWTLLPAVLLAGSTLTARQPPAPAAKPEAGQSSAQDVASALQKKYDSVRDFTADFVQESEGGVLRKKQTESGVVQVKKPGKMRWDYKKPEPKVFVSDGRRIYLHVPADNQVIISPVPQRRPGDDGGAVPGRQRQPGARLHRHFAAGGGARHLRRFGCSRGCRERDYDWLQIVVDRRTLQIRSLSAADSQGGRSTFQFSNFKENVGLADKVFEFKIPRGADVTSHGDASR